MQDQIGKATFKRVRGLAYVPQPTVSTFSYFIGTAALDMSAMADKHYAKGRDACLPVFITTPAERLHIEPVL